MLCEINRSASKNNSSGYEQTGKLTYKHAASQSLFSGSHSAVYLQNSQRAVQMFLLEIGVLLGISGGRDEDSRGTGTSKSGCRGRIPFVPGIRSPLYYYGIEISETASASSIPDFSRATSARLSIPTSFPSSTTGRRRTCSEAIMWTASERDCPG